MSYAGFWKRFAASFIDAIIITIVIFISLIALFMIVGVNDRYALETIKFAGDVLGSWVYFAAMESSSLQGTLGKIALGIKVTDLEGGRISFGRATGRYFSKIISAIVLMIGFIMVAFTAKKQGLHDIIASCLVVNK